MKRLLLLMCLSVGIAHANPTDKQKIIDHLKYFSDDPTESVLSSDGKRRYQKEYSINKDGGVDVRIREKYLPAVTDGKNYTPKSSYFAINPKTLKYISKIGKATNAIGIGLLMIDVLGTGLDDYNVTPAGDVSYTVHGNGKYCVSYGRDETWCGDNPQTLCENWLQVANANTLKYSRNLFADRVVADSNYCKVYGGANKYNGNVGAVIKENKLEKRVMSEREFDEAVRALAKAGNVNAKTVILDAGKDEIITGKHDEAIERLADDITSDDTTDETQPDNPPSDDETTTPNPDDGTADKDKDAPKPDDGTTTTSPTDGTADNSKQDPKTNNNGNFELPPFCSWATVVCDFIDWVKKDDTDKDNEFEFEQDLTPDIDTDIKFNGQCPADVVISGTIFGQVISFTFFEWSKFCGFLAMLKPIIIALASYQAVRIVGGVNVAD